MKHGSIDILVVIVITIVTATLAFTVTPENVPVRILTLPLVLILPGYALTSALFLRQAFGTPERLVFSLGLSLVSVILGGLVLNWTPFGLRTASWSVLLTGITLAACAVTLVRRRGQRILTPEWLGMGGPGFTFHQKLLLGLAALVVTAAIAVSVIGAEQQFRPGFTQLWILPAGGATHAKNIVHIGMSNMESKTMRYRLAVDVDGKVVKEWPSINLSPNQKWEVIFVLPQTEFSGAAKVEVRLYWLQASTRLYRYVVLWLNT